MQNANKSVLIEGLRKGYEDRSPQQHRLICHAIDGCFATHPKQKIRLLTFYLQLRQGKTSIEPNQYPNHSFLIQFNGRNNQKQASMSMIGQETIEVAEGQFVCVLDYHKYLNAQSLGETSIEKELNFWDSSEYFCSMPRKKFLQMIREAEVKVFRENQIAFFQGQQITKTESGSGVFIVRSGQFSYYRSIEGKQIETFRFGPGAIFGALELIQQNKHRSMTARCKTQTSIVYHFSEEAFRRLMLHYSQLVIKNKQKKLIKHLEKVPFQMTKSRSLSDTFRKADQKSNMSALKPLMQSTHFQSLKSMQMTQRSAFPSIRVEEIKQSTTKKFFSNTFKDSLKLEAEGTKRSNYFSLRKEGPLKMYPMASQRSNFISSEFKLLDRLLATRKEVGKQVQQPSEAKVAKQMNTTGVWKRDVIYSFYRENFYKSCKRNPEMIQQ